MKLYIIRNVLCAYTEGVIVVLARSETEALTLARTAWPRMSDYPANGAPDVEEVEIGRKPRYVFSMYGGD